ncbi:CD209 antigen-like protein C [Mesocricetus auratus]|uniref:CD209 antigen-like protein C n=1 Tax=Mesocricetus auratus TaxID=10036 RepID=A0ABM2W9F3_MESAU|nr:CD209 antigen-like protein C [Mesocricetus auratus]
MRSDTMEADKKQQPGLLGWLSHGQGLLVLHLFSIVLLTGLLVAVLVQGPSSLGNEEIYKQLTQLKRGVDSLCRPCPWEWTLFHGKCYFFSKSQRNWNDSYTACQEVEAQLIIIDSDEEYSFLNVISKNKGSAWLGLSDLKKEGTWQWVDGSLMDHSFTKYQMGRPSKSMEAELCAEVTDGLWTTGRCAHKKFWICEKPEAPCPASKV